MGSETRLLETQAQPLASCLTVGYLSVVSQIPSLASPLDCKGSGTLNNMPQTHLPGHLQLGSAEGSSVVRRRAEGALPFLGLQ